MTGQDMVYLPILASQELLWLAVERLCVAFERRIRPCSVSRVTKSNEDAASVRSMQGIYIINSQDFQGPLVFSVSFGGMNS